MLFFKSSRPASSHSSTSSTSSSTRPISPLGTSRYEQPYVPPPPTKRRTPPHRPTIGPENLLVANYDTANLHRRSPPHRATSGPENLSAPAPAPPIVQDLSSLGNWFEPKPHDHALTRHRRPQTSYLPDAARGPKRPGFIPRTGFPLVVSNEEEPDFSKTPKRMDELDSLGNFARPTATAATTRKGGQVGGQVKFNVGRSVMRNGAERAVRVVDTGIVERLRPGYSSRGKGGRRADSPTLPRGGGR